MTITLLLDLDDTLLNTNLDVFLPTYFQKIAAHLAPKIDPSRMLKELVTGTKLMYQSAEVDKTLEDTFNTYYYSALDLPREELAASIEDFYDNVFPTIQSVTNPIPEAVAFIEWAFAQGYQVAICTDPLFPRKAILERMRWANLPPEKYPFAHIPDFQTYHFAKERVAFYPEFLARMGWQDGPVVMVGDSLQRDILPARLAGLPAFWMTDADQPAPEAPDVPFGGFKALKDWLKNGDDSVKQADFSSESAILAWLQATPAVLDTLCRKFSAAQWQARPEIGEWAMCELACHLRDVDVDVNLPRLNQISSEENSFIAGVVTDTWVQERNYIYQDGQTALREYIQARKQVIEKVRQFGPEDWSRRVRHNILGPMTVRELLVFLVEHDRSHLQQALKIVQV